MEIYSDNEYAPKGLRFGIIIISIFFAPFQLVYLFSDIFFFSRLVCGLTALVTFFFPAYLFSKQGQNLLSKRTDMLIALFSYLIFIPTMLILTSVITHSNKFFDSNFYMFSFLILSLVMGIFIGCFFHTKDSFSDRNDNIKVRGNEIEIRKVDIVEGLSFSKMPFLRKPLTKAKNAIVVLACIVGTGGAGIAMGIAELLTRSDILSPDLDTHSVLFFIFGVPVLFTFGVIVYAMMTYLSEWRKLVASIDKEYGEHKIIFNSKKKSYKKIKEIMAESGSNANG
ncbi:hypothetical protein [Vibrio tetraodonis]|uniref:hypothetical protein n=1 Tax=Vibrio tetraodonis TaxID=2231647 RepID=UPI000E0BEF58|nr:hypothetical protein [Vibrio tetraodonis]